LRFLIYKSWSFNKTKDEFFEPSCENTVINKISYAQLLFYIVTGLRNNKQQVAIIFTCEINLVCSHLGGGFAIEPPTQEIEPFPSHQFHIDCPRGLPLLHSGALKTILTAQIISIIAYRYFFLNSINTWHSSNY
jgi:hypothetical protein